MAGLKTKTVIHRQGMQNGKLLQAEKIGRTQAGFSNRPKENIRNADLYREVRSVTVANIRLPQNPQERPER